MLHCTYIHKCTVIYTQKNRMAYHAPIFTEYTMVQHQYVHISNT